LLRLLQPLQSNWIDLHRCIDSVHASPKIELIVNTEQVNGLLDFLAQSATANGLAGEAN
jgi:hypothetical protein